MNPANTACYSTHGFQVFRRVLSPSWLQCTRDAVASIIRQYRTNAPLAQRNGVSLGEFSLAKPERNPGIDGSKLIHEPYIIGDMLTLDRRFVSLLSEYPLWSIAANLLETQAGNIIFHYANLTRKPAGIGPAISWHRDNENTYFCPEGDDFLRLLIPLQDMSQENGGTAVVPGSHLNHSMDKHTLDKDAIAHPDVEAGDVLAIHPCLLHGGSPNRSDRERDVIIVQFGIAGARFRFQEELETGALHTRATFIAL
ncbi:phytanoyl-CoA dioxygenase family protein [Methylobacillus sp.]|uniref:phytanoyl-CoA dioxygenase family protein n=1 Tax=Methylobacillus sp. TaxID=56818 RepID=UPI0012CB484D|nr:phytanoyl-CoA dioxygenase family protein [Methylobacillus sp.]MPS47954.1 phytanoyl-CoA dioxygenase [Methylobacillus sp.]